MVHSPVGLSSAVLVVALGAALATVGPLVPGLAMVLVGLLLSLATVSRVTAGPHGLQVTLSALGRPRKRVPITEIVEAGVTTVAPFADFGGWGYRLRGDATGIVLRAGPALQLRLADGGQLVVTVDDPETPAALLNSEIDRAHARSSEC